MNADTRLNQILDKADFDSYVAALCQRFYADEVGRPLSPGTPRLRPRTLGRSALMLKRRTVMKPLGQQNSPYRTVPKRIKDAGVNRRRSTTALERRCRHWLSCRQAQPVPFDAALLEMRHGIAEIQRKFHGTLRTAASC